MKKYPLKINSNWQAVLTGIGLFALFVILLTYIQFSTPNLVGIDGYFHIRFAQIMRQQGLLPAFIWLPLTILNAQDFYDHHFLFHILMIPFTYGDLRLGAKWIGVIFPTLAFLMAWILLRGQKVYYASLWVFGFFAVAEGFLYRMSMARVQSISLLMLLLILHITLTRRYRWLLPLSFVFIWLYDAFLLVLIIGGAYTLMSWILERRLNIRPLLYISLGLSLGLIINPYFPNNVIFIYHHILPKLIATTTIRVGGEWFPYDTWALVKTSSVALLTFAAGVFALGLNKQRMNTATATLLFITLAYGLMLLKSRRFIEYYPAFSLLFCALAWQPLFNQWPKKIIPTILVLILAIAIYFNIGLTIKELQDTNPYQRYQQASAWLKTNTPAKSRVFQTDWDDFTMLYFYNTHNTYILGLDPTYMQSYDQDLYELWRDITKGRVKIPGKTIADTFQASYVITDLDHVSFIYGTHTDPFLQEVYRDDYAVIYELLEQPRAVPSPSE